MSYYLDVLAVLAAIFLVCFGVLTLGHVAAEGWKWWKRKHRTPPTTLSAISRHPSNGLVRPEGV